MRRIDWTETMLSRLAELYPVETTAHTAYMLQIGVTAVKEKARELGLEKLAKSRWLERAGHISRHFDNRSYAEMAGDLGVSRTTVSRMARKLGLSRSKAKGYAMSSRVRNELVRRERRRAVFGLDPLTRLKVISHRAKVRIRSRLKANGYITGVHRNILYFTEATCRKARLEAKATRLGLSFCLFPKTIHHYPMPYSHAVRTNRFYPFRGNGLLLRLPHLHGHQESAGGPERGKGEPYGRRDRHIGRGKELPSDQSQQGRGEERRSG